MSWPLSPMTSLNRVVFAIMPSSPRATFVPFGAGVAHPASGRRGHPGDESGDRFPAIILNPQGRFFFGGAADLANQNHRLGSGIIVKDLGRIEMRHAIDWVAPDSDAG